MRAIAGCVIAARHQYKAACLNWQSVIEMGHRLLSRVDMRQFKSLCDNDYYLCRDEYHQYDKWEEVCWDGGCLRKVPLPRAPRLQSTALMTCAAPRNSRDTCYLQVPWIPTWSDLVRSHLGVARSTMLPIAPHWLM